MNYKTIPLKEPLKQFQIDNCRQWVEALRSGKYGQTEGKLVSYDMKSFCCLGVACEIKGMEKVIQDCDSMVGFKYLNQNNDSLPDSGYFEFTYGFESGRLMVAKDAFVQSSELATLNDNEGFDFNAIAFVIEAACINRVAIEFSYDRISKELNIKD